MKKFFWGIIVFSVLVRIINIGMPFLEGAATRQIYNIMVAKYFFENGMNILYPQIPIHGNEIYYYALELHLIPYIAALFYKIWGGIYPLIFRIISILFTLLAIGVLYKLIKAILNKKAALMAVFIFSLSPISIYLGRSAQYEMAIIFFNIVTIYYFYQWANKEKFKYALLANLSFVLAVSLKVPNLYLLIPISYLVFSKWGLRAFKKNWIMFFSFLIIFAWQEWLYYLRAIAQHSDWQHFSLTYNLERIYIILTSIEFYKKIYADALNYVLTPLGLVFFILGFFLKKEKNIEKIFYYWLGSVFFFYGLMPEQFGVHGYYHIHYLPIASFFIAKGFLFLIDQNYSKFSFLSSRMIILVFSLIFLLLSARYSIPFYWIPQNKKYVLETARMVQEKIPKNALVISCVDSPAILLYYADRKGWPYDFSQRGAKGITTLENFRAKGAAYFVCSYKKELEVNQVFLEYLKTHYKTIFENKFCLIVDLKKLIKPIRF